MARVVHARPGAARIVPRGIFDATERARRIVTAADADAERVRVEAYARGFEAGRLEALAGQLTAAQARDRALLESEALVVELALAAARKLLQRALELEPERALDVVRPLIAQLRHARRVELHVHPADAALIRCWLGQTATNAAEAEAEGVHVHEDATLTRGGCLVVTERGTLDARVEVQLAALERALLSRP